MKPTTLYLLTLLAVFTGGKNVSADSDSDNDMFASLHDPNDPNLTDTEMKNFNEKLDKLVDRTTRSYEKRVAKLREKLKPHREPTKMELDKILKECFQKKFDYGNHEVGKDGTILEIGQRNIFAEEEI